MGKLRFDQPTDTFPYKISRRLNMMSYPRPVFVDTGEGMPEYTPRGIRKSALKAQLSDRLNDAAYPYLRRFILLKRMYKNSFSPERLQRINRMIDLANITCYSKLANCMIDRKEKSDKDTKKRRAWTESEWKKHMDYINHISKPRRDFKPPPVLRGTKRPLEDFLDRIEEISRPADFKIYKRLSQDIWYRNPVKVAPTALKYVATERVKVLAKPKVLPPSD